MERLAHAIYTHPNVGAVLLVGSGDEGFDFKKLKLNIDQSGRPVTTIGISELRGTKNAIDTGVDWMDWCRSRAADPELAEDLKKSIANAVNYSGLR